MPDMSVGLFWRIVSAAPEHARLSYVVLAASGIAHNIAAHSTSADLSTVRGRQNGTLVSLVLPGGALSRKPGHPCVPDVRSMREAIPARMALRVATVRVPNGRHRRLSATTEPLEDARRATVYQP
jgi:hypothetical protein